MSDGQSEKTFRIEGKQTPKEPQKTFKIEGDLVPTHLPNTDREIMFARQRNPYDCGPCIVLNTLQALGVNSRLFTVDDVRSYANKLRIAENKRPLPANGWFTNIDVDEVLFAKGLNVKSWSADEEESRRRLKEYTEELVRSGREFVAYTGSGRHYKGLYKNGENGIFELDSLRQDIPRVGVVAIETMIARAAQSDRIESISVASRTSTTQ